MGITKKAISVGLSATMLATLLATAFAGSAFAASTLAVSAASPIVTAGGTDLITLTSSGVTSGATLTVSTSLGNFTAISNSTTTGIWSTTPTTVLPAASVAAATTFAAGTSTVTLTAPAASYGSSITVTFTDGTTTVTTVVQVGGSAPTPCANGPYGTAYPYCASATSQVADGVSYIALKWGTANPTASVISVSVKGGYFIAGTGVGTQTFPLTSIVLTGTPTLDGAVLWLASTTAGTASVTLTFSTGTGYTDSIASFTFTGATSTTVSTSYSSTSAASSSVAAVAGTTDALTTTVADTNNNLIPVGATVTWTVTGPAVFPTVPVSQTSGSTPVNGGKATINLVSTGTPGTATVATTVSYLGVTYTLANETVSFYGPVAKIVATNEAYSINSANTTTAGTGALDVALTDAAGNAITSGVTWGTPTYTPANIFTISVVPTGLDSAGTGYLFNVTCVADGTATVSVNATTPALSSTSVTSNTVTFTCADGLGSTTPGTFTASAASTTVAPNGNTTITVKVLDDNKLPAPDGTPVVAVTNGVGAVVNTSGAANGTTSNGTATFTYLAPSNAGSGTVTIFVANATPASQAITFTIGTAATTSATAGSALGLATSGFSATTKVAKFGQYVTWQFGFGASAANKNVTILVATKSSSGVWSAFKALTGRIADANGNAYFHWKYSTATWISVRGQLDSTTLTPARQARWM